MKKLLPLAFLLLLAPAAALAARHPSVNGRAPSHPTCKSAASSISTQGKGLNGDNLKALCHPMVCEQSYGGRKELTVVHGMSSKHACIYGQQISSGQQLVCTLNRIEMIGLYDYLSSGSNQSAAMSKPGQAHYVQAFMSAGKQSSRCRQFPIFPSSPADAGGHAPKRVGALHGRLPIPVPSH